ncbi:carbohydrate-binding protein [Cohnella kolymensis]|uniref:CBM35 domain-containing protein n=1 Tax=Cohnella kolymensis TaxID=1590652 RepID=UPI000695E878|nr:CBM35 domain-containing protein [Cohnella kolymensis]
MKNQWTGAYLFEEDGKVKYGEPRYTDPASQWIAEDSGNEVRLRNTSTGHYVTTVDHVGGSPAESTAVPDVTAAASRWKMAPAINGEGNAVVDYVTFQSAENSASFLNVQSQDGYAHGNNWAQPAWGSVQWKLEDPAAPSEEPEDPLSPYIRIKNNWLQLYLYEEDGKVKYGNAKADNLNAHWLIEEEGGKKRIKNRGTGHYMTLEGVQGSRDAIRASDVAQGSDLADWVIVEYQGFKQIYSAADEQADPTSRPFIHVENKLKVAQYGVVPRDWGSPKWEFVPVSQSEDVSFVRLKNRYHGTYLYEQDGKVSYGSPEENDSKSHWAIETGAQGKLIVNRATGHLITNEHVGTHTDPVESLDLDRTWGSVQWREEPVSGTDYKVFRNVWKTDAVLHDEDQTGYAQASSIPADWHSAQWLAEPAPDLPVELPQGNIRIKNNANGQYLYENRNNVVLYGTPGTEDGTSHWLLETEGGVQRIKNRATGNYMSIENLKSYLETSSDSEVAGGKAHWLVEKAPSGEHFLLRSAAEGHQDEYVHAEDSQGYPQYDLRSVESSGVQWAFEAAPETFIIPEEEDKAEGGSMPVFADTNYIRLKNKETNQWLVVNEGKVGFRTTSVKDTSSHWLLEETNGRKRLKNRQSELYLTASADGSVLLTTAGQEDGAQWKVGENSGYRTFTNAHVSDHRLVSDGSAVRVMPASETFAASHWLVEEVPGDAVYEAEYAFSSGGVRTAAERPGFSGDGYADHFDEADARLIFSVNAQTAGSYSATLYYANEGASNGRLALYVNGLKQKAIPLPEKKDGGWKQRSVQLPLRAGMNTVLWRPNEEFPCKQLLIS